MEKAKTIEEYILNELKEARENVKASVLLLKTAMAVLDRKNALLEIFRSRLEIRTLPDGTRVIGMSPVFGTFDRAEFELLEEFLKPGEEEEED